MQPACCVQHIQNTVLLSPTLSINRFNSHATASSGLDAFHHFQNGHAAFAHSSTNSMRPSMISRAMKVVKLSPSRTPGWWQALSRIQAPQTVPTPGRLKSKASISKIISSIIKARANKPPNCREMIIIRSHCTKYQKLVCKCKHIG